MFSWWTEAIAIRAGCLCRQILADGVGVGQPLAEVRATAVQQAAQPVTHESHEPDVAAFAQQPAEPGVVLVNHVGVLGQLGHPRARKRLAEPQGGLLAHKLRSRARNDRRVVLDPGAPRRTIRLAGFTEALLHLGVKPGVYIPRTPMLDRESGVLGKR